MVYKSFTDAIRTGDLVKAYLRNGNEHFNRLYFKYPPEWKTSNVGEKKIGIRNMKISIRKLMRLEFILYIRKYWQDKFNELATSLYPVIEQIQDVVNRMDREDFHVYKIEYIYDIDDDIDDFIENLYYKSNDANIYNKIHDNILVSNMSNEEKIDALEQFNADKDV